MTEAFIVMQIGNDEMDRVCDGAIVPAIRAAGLTPRRVDRDSEGGILKAEIITFLERCQIIVADLTNERPNCYLEVGYAMGLGKQRNLILTTRGDHHHSNPGYRHDGPRVHFDLEGYDLMLWDPLHLPDFKAQLAERISRRLAILEPSEPAQPDKSPRERSPAADAEWLMANRTAALAGLNDVGRSGFVEAVVALSPKGSWRQRAILSAVEDSQITTFGWPIGIVIDRDPYRPYPTADGVQAEVAIRANDPDGLARPSYDLWAFRSTGDFYLLQSLFEDERTSNAIFFDTRIVRTTELLLFLARCFSRLDVAPSTVVRLEVTHSGLQDRVLRVADRRRRVSIERTTREQAVTSLVECKVAELESRLTENVKAVLAPLFEVFDFFDPADETWVELIDTFVAGRMG